MELQLFNIPVMFEKGPCIVKYVLAQSLVQFGILLENSFAHSLGTTYNPATSTKEEIELHNDSMDKIRKAMWGARHALSSTDPSPVTPGARRARPSPFAPR